MYDDIGVLYALTFNFISILKHLSCHCNFFLKSHIVNQCVFLKWCGISLGMCGDGLPQRHLIIPLYSLECLI